MPSRIGPRYPRLLSLCLCAALLTQPGCYLLTVGGRSLDLWLLAPGAILIVIGGRALMRLGENRDSKPHERFLLALIGGAAFLLG